MEVSYIEVENYTTRVGSGKEDMGKALTGRIKHQLCPVTSQIQPFRTQLDRLQFAHSSWSWPQVLETGSHLY